MILKDLFFEGILKECENVMLNRLGFVVPLIRKEFDEAILIPYHPDADDSTAALFHPDYVYNDLKDYMSPDIFELIQCAGDVSVAKLFVTLYGENFKCSSIKNNLWYDFKDHKWNECEAGHKLRNVIVNEFRDDIIKVIFKLKMNKDRKLASVCEKLASVCDRLRRSNDINNVMHELKTMLYEEKFADRLDSNGNLLCCSNGIFDFKMGLLREGKPEDMCSISTNIPYLEYNEVEIGAYKKLVNFIEEVFPFEDQRFYMQNHLASMLLGNPKINQIFTNYVGVGANGKSTLVSLLEATIGGYFGRIPASLVTQKRPSIGGASPEVALLRGTRMAVIQEPMKGDKINEGIMKELTGDEYMQGRKLFRDTVTFLVMFGLVVCTNSLMTVNSNDNGTWRRIRVVEFPSTFVDNPDIFDPLQFKKDPHLDIKEMAIPCLSFLIELAVKTKGRVEECELVTTATNKYRDTQNRIGQFIAECITPDSYSAVAKVVLSSACSEWFETNYKYRINNKQLFDLLDKDYEYLNGSYNGIKMINNSTSKQIITTKEETFLIMFNKRFEITRDSIHHLKSTRICEWAKTSCLKVDSSKSINAIILNAHNLDVKNKEHYKKKRTTDGFFYFWIGIKEKPIVEYKK